MLFLDRKEELTRLRELPRGGLAVLWGRRRIGKTRLLVEWCRREHGLYTVADQSSPELQRAYFASALATVLPGFDAVTYPDWGTLLARLAADAETRGFRGPLVFDELPYLVMASPELPSILQRWIDHDVQRAGLRVALAGSSQRMMQGLVLDHAAPLFGRAHMTLDLRGIPAVHLPAAFGGLSPVEIVEHWAAWGGVPRYWELASARRGSARDRLVALALDPNGPLFAEPERLLQEETPPAIEMRPLLDVIGAGAHRLSEIAGRLGRPATSLGRALDRVIGLGLVERETPYGEPKRSGKRSLYKLADPFLRVWMRVVAPHRAALTTGTVASRRQLLDESWEQLAGEAWEELVRLGIPGLRRPGPWQPPSRYWHGAEPEWDAVAESIDRKRILVGEAWFAARPVSATVLAREAARLAARAVPAPVAGRAIVRALFVPSIAGARVGIIDGVHIVTLAELLR